MLSPESLVRLRPWIFRLLVAALLGAGIMGLLDTLLYRFPYSEGSVPASLIVIAVASICALNCISYTRRRERTGPALIGLGLLALATVGMLAEVWFDEAVGGLASPIYSLSTTAVAWTFILAVYSERLPARLLIVQHLTASCIAGFGAVIALNFLGEWYVDTGKRLLGSLGIVSFFGLLIVIALAHHYRSGVRALVPMAHVLSVPRAMEFYKNLGFQCENSFAAPEATEPVWAWMETPGGAQLMLVCAEEPVLAAQQGVLFYVYCDDLPAKHKDLLARGITVGPIERPFYAPRGEFRVTDPDGYTLMLSHT